MKTWAPVNWLLVFLAWSLDRESEQFPGHPASLHDSGPSPCSRSFRSLVLAPYPAIMMEQGASPIRWTICPFHASPQRSAERHSYFRSAVRGVSRWVKDRNRCARQQGGNASFGPSTNQGRSTRRASPRQIGHSKWGRGCFILIEDEVLTREPNDLVDRAKLRSSERAEARGGRIPDVFDRRATKGRDAIARFHDGSLSVQRSVRSASPFLMESSSCLRGNAFKDPKTQRAMAGSRSALAR
jgi:hypothetical protein